jgi:hypothetical protein
MGPNWLGDKPKIIGTVRDIETKWMVVELDDELDLPPNDEKGWPSYGPKGDPQHFRTAAGKWLLLKKGWVGQEWNEPTGRINVFLTSLPPVLEDLSGDRGIGVWAESHAEMWHCERQNDVTLDERTGVTVLTKFPVNQFSLRRKMTCVEIDRTRSIVPWGSHFFPLNPGSHEIEIGFQSWGRIFAKSQARVEVVQGQTVSLVYQTRWYWGFRPGSIAVL